MRNLLVYQKFFLVIAQSYLNVFKLFLAQMTIKICFWLSCVKKIIATANQVFNSGPLAFAKSRIIASGIEKRKPLP